MPRAFTARRRVSQTSGANTVAQLLLTTRLHTGWLLVFELWMLFMLGDASDVFYSEFCML